MRPPLLTLLTFVSLLMPLAARSQSTIVRDGTLGTGPAGALLAAGEVSVNGNRYNRIAIPESYGTRVGGNIFHSFRTFAVGAGDGAVFGTAAPAGNIIARVTGGAVSQIGGLLRVDPGAGASATNLFLINPAGVTFGAGAALDVPGAFHVGTATTLVFPNGQFETDPGRSSTLTSADPSAFGFSGTRPGLVALDNGTLLQAAAGQAVTVAAGAIRIDGASIETRNADLRLAAVGGAPASVPVAGPLPRGLQGMLEMAGNASASTITANALPAGNLHAGAGELYLGDGFTPGQVTVGSASLAGSSGAAGAVVLEAGGLLYLDRGANVLTSNSGTGDGGAIAARAQNIVIDGGGAFAGIYTYAASGSTGKAGAVGVHAADVLSVSRGATVASQADGAGDAGAVALSAADLAVHDGGIVSSAAREGNAGTVGLDAAYVTIGGGRGNSSVYSSLSPDARGAAGTIAIHAAQELAIHGGGLVFTQSGGAPGGAIAVDAGSVVIDGGSGEAGIKTRTQGTGSAAGAIALRSTGELAMRNRGYILSETLGTGASGAIDIGARNIDIAGALSGIGSDAGPTARGAAAAVRVTAQQRLALREGAAITSASSGAGHAGSVRLQAQELLIDGAGASTFVSSSVLPGSSGNAGRVELIAAGSLSLLGGAQVRSDTGGTGDAGSVAIRAHSMLVENKAPMGDGHATDSGVGTDARPGSSGRAGTIDIAVTDHLALAGGASIASDLRGTGKGGAIAIAAGRITLGGTPERLALITSTADPGTTGDAGAIFLQAAGLLAMPGDGYILTSTYGSGNGGAVQVRAGAIDMGGTGRSAIILSNALEGSSGNAGTLDINAPGRILIGDGAFIQSGTRGTGNGGAIAVQAGTLRMESGPNVAEISSNAGRGSSGHAGSLSIKTAGALELVNGAVISSDTFASGNAGKIDVDAGNILLDGKGSDTVTGIFGLVRATGSGAGGSLTVRARGALALHDGGEISSSTYGSGHAGSVSVRAASADIVTGVLKVSRIASDSLAGSSGNAGVVDLRVDHGLALRNGGMITSSTGGSGAGGALHIEADTVLLDLSEISASAAQGSSGRVGSLDLAVRESLTLQNNSAVSLFNEATLTAPGSVLPNSLRVSAPRIVLARSLLSTESFGNVGASPLTVAFGDALLLRDGAAISTQAQDGNGGALTLRGGKLLSLENGRIVTSVFGTAGNGGDIAIDAGTLLLRTGFIQANTAAPNSKGGDVAIRAGAFLSSGNSLFLGGAKRYAFSRDVFGLNVIQAAAPDGVSGTVVLSTPALDLAGSLDALPAEPIDAGGVGRNPCQAQGGSTLSVGRQGALAPSARGLLGPAAPAPARTAQVLEPGCGQG